MKSLSIRWRLTLWYAAAMVGVLSLFCVMLLILTRQQSMSRLDAALREELRELVLEMQLARDSEQFKEHVHTRFFEHDVYDFLIIDEQGHVLFASSGISAPLSNALSSLKTTSALTYLNCDIEGTSSIRSAARTVTCPAGVFSVLAVTSLGPLQADMQALQLLMLVMIPITLILALAGGYFLAARALAPVDQIVRVAETITISNLDQRIEIVNPNDELGRLSHTLNSLIARLQRAVEEIQRFTADASHELRTPLAVLRSEAELALRHLRSPQEYQQTLGTVVEEATRLGRLADQLLNLSRHDSGLVDCRREPVRLDAVLKDVVEQVRPLSMEQRIGLEMTSVLPCELIGDDLLLAQALFNVLENAIKFTNPGGTATVACEVKDNAILVTVHDTGIGIPREHLSRVFDRFYRVDPSRHPTTGGTGLGLAIARTNIQWHGGQIQIDSQQGVGTTVTIRLPGSVVESGAISSTDLPVNELQGVSARE